VLQREMRFAAKLMQFGDTRQGEHQAQGVRRLLGQSERLLTGLGGLVGIAEIPEGPSMEVEATYARIGTVDKSMGLMLSGLIECSQMFLVSERGAEVALDEQDRLERTMRFHQQARILCRLCDPE